MNLFVDELQHIVKLIQKHQPASSLGKSLSARYAREVGEKDRNATARLRETEESEYIVEAISKISTSDEGRRRTGVHELELSMDDMACTRLPPPVQSDRQIATPRRRKRVQYTYSQINPVYAEREGRVAGAGQLYLHKNLGLTGLVPGLAMQRSGAFDLRYRFPT